jgi:glycerophosphoryl diester phosphodiesterase
MAAFGTVKAISRWAVPPVSDRLSWLLPVLGVVLVLWVAAHLLANVAVMAGLGTVGTRLYERTSDGTAAARSWEEEGTQAGPGARTLSNRMLVGLLAGSLVVAVGFGGLLLRGIRLDTRVEIIAHRGASAAAPENTMAAFDAAMQQGTDWIELDVQEAADGAVVVMHDADLMRLGRSPLRIWESTAEQIAGIDIGSWFGAEFAGERVPTLESVLLRCKGRAKVVIELKYYGHDQRLEERVAEIVERTGMQDRISVMSLRYEMVRKMKSLRPGWTVGLLTATAVGQLAAMEGDFLAVSTGMATPARVRAAHAAGKKLFVWTVDDPMTMALMVARGADGLITNEPAVARSLLRRMDEATTGERLLLGLASWFGIEPRATDVSRDAS